MRVKALVKELWYQYLKSIFIEWSEFIFDIHTKILRKFKPFTLLYSGMSIVIGKSDPPFCFWDCSECFSKAIKLLIFVFFFFFVFSFKILLNITLKEVYKV